MKKRLVTAAKKAMDPEWWEKAPASEKARVRRRFKRRERRLIERQEKADNGE